MPYVTAAVIAGTAIYGAIESQDRKQQAKAGINRLKKLNPQYKTALEIQTEAESAVQEGYSPSEVAAFRQGLARQNRASYRAATQSNPNLASQVQAGINYGNVNAQSEFAARDAALRRDRIREYANRITGQSNAQTSADIQNKYNQEMAYGQAKSQANADFYNSLTQLGYAATLVPYGSGGGGGNKVAPTTLSPSQPPSMSAMNAPAPNNQYYGTDSWARGLYGQGNTRVYQDYFGYPSRYKAPNPNIPITDPYYYKYSQ